MTNKKCSSCGGNLIFSPSNCSLVCEKCKTITPIITTNNYVKKSYDAFINSELSQNKTTNENSKKIVNCPTCGASLNLKTSEFSGNCPYCGSSIVVDNTKQNLSVDAVIPFQIDKDSVYENYKKSVRKKLFIPNAFKRQPPMDNVTGFYIPAFGFDADTSSDYEGKLENEHRDKNGNTHVSTKTIRGHVNINFQDVMIESSSKINQLDLDEILPFNVKQAYSYDDDFIRGYSVEKFNDSLKTCFILAMQEMKQRIEDQILSKYTYSRVVYFNCNTTTMNRKFCYYLLPVYSINFEYKNKKYTTLMNGQTGKVGLGIPKSKVKITFAVIGVILFLLMFVLISFFANNN